MTGKRHMLDVTDLVQRYESGESVNALSQSLGVARNVVSRRLAEAGVTERGRSEAERVKWSRMTPLQRTNQVKEANQAVRGTPRGDAEMERRAAAQCRRVGAGEEELIKFLGTLGVHAEHQRPVGRYNLDVAVDNVAVEVHRTPQHPHGMARHRKRIEDLFSRGYVSLYVWLRPWELPTKETAEHVVAWLNLARRDPTTFGQYRVIRGDGHEQTRQGERYRRA